MNAASPSFTLFLSLVLPWACGIVFTRSLLAKSVNKNWFIVVGHGFFIGTCFAAAAIVIWNAAGFSLSFWGPAGVLILLTGVFATVAGLRSGPGTGTARQPFERWEVLGSLLLVTLILVRYQGLALDTLLRPLYPWDGWMNWAPKAIVWFHNSSLVPFVNGDSWLSQSEGSPVFTLGNWYAGEYPDLIPLMQLFTMLGAGAVDHPAVYLPWILIIAALGLAMYGHLRLAGLPMFLSTLCCYVLLSMPYVNVHGTLGGYADIWLAAGFAYAAFALHVWHTHRDRAYALIAILAAIACTQLKVAGVVLGAIIIAGLIASVFKLRALRLLQIGAVSVLAIAAALYLGISVDIPNIGHVSLHADEITLPYLGELDLSFHAVQHAFLKAMFIMLNWHLLWYLSAVIITACCYRAVRDTTTDSPLSILLVLAFGFIAIVFFFTQYYVAAEDFTGLNRALLHLVPTLVFALAVSVLKLSGPVRE